MEKNFSWKEISAFVEHEFKRDVIMKKEVNNLRLRKNKRENASRHFYHKILKEPLLCDFSSLQRYIHNR